MKQRVAIVTGATGAIGLAIADGLAARPEFEVVLVVRDAKKAEQALVAIRKEHTAARVRAEIVDLSRRAEIRALSERFSGPLHLLVNNAAIAPRRRTETPEGIELQFATNVLGYVWMTECFVSALERGAKESGAPARVVNVASYWAGDLDLDDLEFRRRRYDNDTAYRQSKQANRMLSAAQAERLFSRQIHVNACHPGDVSSTLSHALGFGGSASPEEGAETPLWVALAPELAGVTGRYFEHHAERPCRFAADRSRVEALAHRVAEYSA